MSGLSDRIAIASAKASNKMEEAAFIQDPGRAIDEALEEMQQGLERLRWSTVSAINSQSKLRLQLQQAQAEADRWQQRVQLAQRKRNESLAEGALERQQSWLVTAASLTAQLKRQSDTIEALERQQVEGRGKLAQARDKRDALIERAKKASANSQLQSTMGRLGSGSAMDALDRLENKVLQIEVRSQLATELAGADLESVPLLLEPSDKVDDEIERLKEQLLGSVRQPQHFDGHIAESPITKALPIVVNKNNLSSNVLDLELNSVVREIQYQAGRLEAVDVALLIGSEQQPITENRLLYRMFSSLRRSLNSSCKIFFQDSEEDTEAIETAVLDICAFLKELSSGMNSNEVSTVLLKRLLEEIVLQLTDLSLEL